MSISRIAILVLVIGFGLSSCAGDKKNPDVSDDTSAPSIQQTPQSTNPAATPPPTQEPAQNAEGVWHYTCPNGCEGGAGSAVACENCGTMLKHNQAYHGSILTQEQMQNQLNQQGAAQQQINMQQQQPPQTPEPAQNDQGVWHYTCPNGCAGGAGSATACSNCGTQLQHNTAYHQ